MAYITNGGARLIERAKNEGKSIAFGSVRMNTIYKPDPSSLVQKTDAWFGANHGSVVGCLSHVAVDDVSCVCDSKLAVQCNDNSESWKSIGIYAHLDGEVDELLFACESIQNGEYKDVTLVELPVTLDGVVEDFGLSEGGSGGGGDVPANMMTTNTEQTGLSGVKQWDKQSFIGKGSAENPEEYDLLNVSQAIIGSLDGESFPVQCSNTQQFYNGSEWVSGSQSYAKLSTLGVLQMNSGETFDQEEHVFIGGESLEITPNGVQYVKPDSDTLGTTWANIINAANSGGGDVPANMMTTNTEQVGLSGTKTWNWETYSGEGTVDEPQDGDIRTNESISIDSIEGNHIPLVLDSNEEHYSSKEGWYPKKERHLRITSGGITLNDSFVPWSNIFKASRNESGFDHVAVRENEGAVYIESDQVKPNSEIKIGTYAMLTIDNNGQIASIHSSSGVLDISAAVYDNGSMHRVSGIVSEDAGISFDSPVTPQEGQVIYIHWTKYE